MITYDTHAHLDHLENLDDALENARIAGVAAIVAVSMDFESCKKSLAIKQSVSQPKIYLGMGMHPSEASLTGLEDCLAFTKANLGHLTVIGEIGLDFWYKWVRKDKEKKDEQREVFRQFLMLAKDANLPVVIHSRGVWRECFETTRELGISKAEFHWYSGPIDVLKDIIDAGYYVSTTPSLAYSPQSQEAILQAPIEQVLIETDCPVYFNNKETGEGFKAEPKDVFRTLKAYCDLKHIEIEQAVNQFNLNAEKFFGIEVEDK